MRFPLTEGMCQPPHYSSHAAPRIKVLSFSSLYNTYIPLHTYLCSCLSSVCLCFYELCVSACVLCSCVVVCICTCVCLFLLFVMYVRIRNMFLPVFIMTVCVCLFCLFHLSYTCVCICMHVLYNIMYVCNGCSVV